MTTRSRLLWLLLLVPGCHSYEKDLENLCNVDERSGASKVADPAQKQRLQAGWLNQQSFSYEGNRLARQLTQLAVEQRNALLKKEAAAHGLPSCPFAEAPTVPGPGSAP